MYALSLLVVGNDSSLHFRAVVEFGSYIATSPLGTCRNLVGFMTWFRLIREDKRQRSSYTNPQSPGIPG